MRLIDEEFLKHLWMGVPKMTQWLIKDKGILVNHKRVRRLYKKLGLCACVPGIKTTKKGKGRGHTVFPYLLRSLEITAPNQVWAMDITYIPVQGGYFYLCAVIDLYSRMAVSWSISNAMDAEWCRDTLAEAVERYGSPEILNTDQGSQFTSELFTSWVQKNGIKLSMDGKGRAIDNIFIERLWRSVKHEEVYLYGYTDGKAAYSKIEKGLRSLTVDELQKMSQLFNMTTDQILNHDGKVPKEVVIEDKTAVEQMRLIQQLDEEDKQTIFRLIDKMLTNKKFKDFFQKNAAAL